MQSGMMAFLPDVLSATVSALLLLAYHAYLFYRVRRNPAYTVQAVNNMARAEWVDSVMKEGKDILAIQTLRNSTMAATFLASTAILLIIGVLTMTGRGDEMGHSWHALNVVGGEHGELFLLKLLVILLDLFAAFFAFSMSIRLFNHVGFMINVPLERKHKVIDVQHVATHLNRAGKYYSIGMRTYYFLVPLIFWLFGPHFLVAATIGLVLVLYNADRAPKGLREEVLE